MNSRLKIRDPISRPLLALSRICRTTVTKIPAPSSWLTTFMQEVFGLFPTPFMRAPRVLGDALVSGLIAHFSGNVELANSSSPNLAHTTLLRPGDSPLLVDVAALLSPLLPEFGALMFGERLGWSLKEMWVNVLDTGGRQAMHNHANSFISGVVYLTPTHPDSQTVFMKASGSTEFVFKHEHADITPTPFNADRWIGPAPAPGDLVLFPSYVLHAVPPNQGGRRITLSFNAIPGGLDSWGYKVRFGT